MTFCLFPSTPPLLGSFEVPRHPPKQTKVPVVPCLTWSPYPDTHSRCKFHPCAVNPILETVSLTRFWNHFLANPSNCRLLPQTHLQITVSLLSLHTPQSRSLASSNRYSDHILLVSHVIVTHLAYFPRLRLVFLVSFGPIWHTQVPLVTSGCSLSIFSTSLSIFVPYCPVVFL